MAATDTAVVPSGTNRIQPSLFARARQNETEALVIMFSQFIPAEEKIYRVEYLGVQGLWGIGTHSFACVTERRVSSIRVKLFGAVEYQDASLEYLNSGAIQHPSKVLLYVYCALFSIVTLGIGLLLLPLTVRLYYGFNKSGLVFWVREGVSVYLFSDQKLLPRAAELYRLAIGVREGRLAEVGQPI